MPLIPYKFFLLFKFNNVFAYKEYLFNQYLQKLYISFIRILVKKNLSIRSTLLPTDVFISRFSLEFFSLLDLSYNLFFTSKDLIFTSLDFITQNKSSSSNIIEYSSSYSKSEVRLTIPFGYVRY